MTTPEILYTVWSIKEDVAVHVTQGRKGFHVATQNIESEEFLPTVYIMPTRERAIEKAREIAGVL